MTSESKSSHITRESLQSWRVATLARERDGTNTTIASEDQLLESRRAMIPDDTDCRDLWVFGYGSLICNPIIAYEQRLIARIHGYHRRFCLWTQIGRGSPECPGLVLSLDRGGSCVGVWLQITVRYRDCRLDLLWRREMMTLAYNARWLRLHTDDGIKRGLAFVANPQRPAYAPPMPFENLVTTVATAIGFNGPCHDYLFDTIAGMTDCGIRDHSMEKLADAVSQRLASAE